MVADLHAHYAMHLAPEDQPSTVELLGPGARRLRRSDRLRASIVGLLGRFANYPKPDALPRVTLQTLQAGQVRLVFSVLYSPFDEMDLGQPYAAPPQPEYPATLVRQLELVEGDVTGHHAGTAVVAHDAQELERLLESGKVVFVHSVEGGFHLGSTTVEVERAVAELARRGVAYVTLAHLFFRRVATNAPAIPFIPDWIYRLVFPQPRQGLTELGKTAVEALVEQRILIDLAHMGERALADTFALLDQDRPAAHGAGAVHARGLPLRPPGVQPERRHRPEHRRTRRRDRPDLRQPPDPRRARPAQAALAVRLRGGARPPHRPDQGAHRLAPARGDRLGPRRLHQAHARRASRRWPTWPRSRRRSRAATGPRTPG